jgi:hypothetical protein
MELRSVFLLLAGVAATLVASANTPAAADAGDDNDDTSTGAAEPTFHFKTAIVDEPPEVDPTLWVDTMLVHPLSPLSGDRYYTLSADDYREVAEELDIEVAAIKAVVEVEAGLAHKGFWAPGKPLINFDLTIYRSRAPKCGVSLTSARKQQPVIFSPPNAKRYGSYQAAQQARLDAACSIQRSSALESTFWGMFQIGGFNWKQCGVNSVEEFVQMMSRSERDQLELFARFITANNMVDAIRRGNWLQFALKYNGPKAKARGYHTRLAAAYRRYKAES